MDNISLAITALCSTRIAQQKFIFGYYSAYVIQKQPLAQNFLNFINPNWIL